MKFTNISKKNKARLIFYPLFLIAVTTSVFWMKWMPVKVIKVNNLSKNCYSVILFLV